MMQFTNATILRNDIITKILYIDFKSFNSMLNTQSNLKYFLFFTGMHCVHIAAQRNDIEILRHLVCFGADINARVSNRFLYYVVFNNSKTM